MRVHTTRRSWGKDANSYSGMHGWARENQSDSPRPSPNETEFDTVPRVAFGSSDSRSVFAMPTIFKRIHRQGSPRQDCSRRRAVLGVSRRCPTSSDACAGDPQKGTGEPRGGCGRGSGIAGTLAADGKERRRAARADERIPHRHQLWPRRRPIGRSLAHSHSRRPGLALAAGIVLGVRCVGTAFRLFFCL